MEVRPYDPADEDAVLALWAQQPDYAPSPLDRGVLRLGDRYDVQRVLTDAGRVVAYAGAARPPWIPSDELVFVQLFVDRVHRERGLGARMWGEIRAGVGPAEALLCSVPDRDEHTLAVARHWGFEPMHHPIEVAVRWEHRPEAAAPPPGYRFERLADTRALDRPDVDRMLAEADTSPESAIGGAATMAGFAASDHRVLAVVVWDELAPVGAIFATGEDVEGHVLLTAVHPRHRRKGLARALKEQLHRDAYDRGIRHLATTNEEANTGIRALNRELGYVRVRGAYRMRLPLA